MSGAAGETFDVIVVGLGPGGEFAANKIARGGRSVLAVDLHLVGGECPFYGCIPSKLMMRAATAVAEATEVPGVAGPCDVDPQWGPVAARIAEKTHHWDDRISVERLEESGATVLHGRARLAGEKQVEGDGRTFTARQGVVLATGTRPGVPPVDGLEDTPYWTNRDIVKVTELPESLVVMGGGPIGCELAQAMTRFGVDVTLVEMADRVLVKEEPEVSTLLAEVLRRDGMRVLTGAEVTRVAHDGNGFTVTVDGEDVRAERLLVAAGRDTGLPDLGLETVGIEPDGKFLDTDGLMRVQGADGAVPGLWAVGDIVGQGLFTHTAKYQAAIVIRQHLDKDTDEADHRAVPRVTFTYPEVGAVGMTEQQARDAGLDVRTGSVDLRDSTRGDLHGEGNDGMIKLVADGDRLVGASSVGPMGGEVLAMLTLAIHAEVPVPALRSMIYAYPTWHGAVRQALADLG
jgi:pyruvate/2-oxoglutarate dehydrogenase complex dihydrolipoamide dehydrogenase (E3) component